MKRYNMNTRAGSEGGSPKKIVNFELGRRRFRFRMKFAVLKLITALFIPSPTLSERDAESAGECLTNVLFLRPGVQRRQGLCTPESKTSNPQHFPTKIDHF